MNLGNKLCRAINNKVTINSEGKPESLCNGIFCDECFLSPYSFYSNRIQNTCFKLHPIITKNTYLNKLIEIP